MSEMTTDGKEETRETFGAAPHERPVPRISIEVFTEYTDTRAVMERAAEDRRLAKAHLVVHQGGIATAVAHYGENPTPNLLIVETAARGAAALAELEHLSAVCDAATKVIVVGRVNDVQLYREMIRRGVSEYLVAPLTPLQLIEAVSGLYVSPDAPPIGRVVAFAGARGGAGASAIAHNVAWYIAEELKIDTAIVDFDLAYGTAGLNFNEDAAGQGVAEALAAPERLDDVLLERLLIKCGEHLSLFAAPAMLDRVYDADINAYESVIDQVRSTTPCVIVDMPHSWSEWLRQVLLSADDIVIVATPDLASLRNAKNMMDLLRHHRPNDKPPYLVLNQCGVPKRPEIPVKEFAAALELQPAAVIPFDPQLFGTAANNGQMIGEFQPKSRIAESLRTMAERITGRSIQRAAKKPALPFLPFLSLRKAG